jgi:hypothetical protein
MSRAMVETKEIRVMSLNLERVSNITKWKFDGSAVAEGCRVSSESGKGPPRLLIDPR